MSRKFPDTAVKAHFIEDTRIENAGVLRCCLATVADEFYKPEKKHVALGTQSACLHCKTQFTLVEVEGRELPVWKPNWQIEADKASK